MGRRYLTDDEVKQMGLPAPKRRYLSPDEVKAAGLEPAPQPAAEPEKSTYDTINDMGNAFVRKAGDVMTFGLSEQVIKKGRELLHGENEAAYEKQKAQVEKDNPGSTVAGAVLGMAVPQRIASAGLAKVARYAPALTKIIGKTGTVKNAMATSATAAALREGAHVDDRSAGDRVEDVALHSIIEGGLGGVGQAVGSGISKIAKGAINKGHQITRGLWDEAMEAGRSRAGQIGKQNQEAVNGAANLLAENQAFAAFMNKQPGWKQLPGGKELAALEAKYPGIIRSMLDKRAGNAVNKIEDLVENPLQRIDVNKLYSELVHGQQRAADAAVKSSAGKAVGAAAWRGAIGGGTFGPAGALFGVGSTYKTAAELGRAIWNNPRWLSRISKTMGPLGANIERAAKVGPGALGAAITVLRSKDPSALEKIQALEQEEQPAQAMPPL